MVRFHQPDQQGNLGFFPEDQQRNVKYFPFLTYIAPSLLEDFNREFQAIGKDFEYYEVGVFILIKCNVINVYEAGKLSERYFKYPKLLTNGC